MFKGESGSSRFSSITAAGAPSGQRSSDRADTRATTPGQIGFVGLGRMGTAMAMRRSLESPQELVSPPAGTVM